MDAAAFVDFLVESGVLTFGDFTTKSGRATPYFLNFGNLGTAAQVDTVGRAYGEVVARDYPDVDVLFGPAYKAIPLVVATAIALGRDHGMDVAWCFNRKEVKDHGEGGALVGRVPADGERVVIIEDVTTAGTSIRETVPILRAVADVEIVGLVISVDRRERADRADMTALEELAREFGFTTTAITDIDEVIRVLDQPGRAVLDAADRARLDQYRKRWGVA